MKVWDLGGVPGDVCDHSDVHHPNRYQPKIEKSCSNEQTYSFLDVLSKNYFRPNHIEFFVKNWKSLISKYERHCRAPIKRAIKSQASINHVNAVNNSGKTYIVETIKKRKLISDDTTAAAADVARCAVPDTSFAPETEIHSVNYKQQAYSMDKEISFNERASFSSVEVQDQAATITPTLGQHLPVRMALKLVVVKPMTASNDAAEEDSIRVLESLKKTA
ncbi:unnamed protein product [Mucor circinelloides]